MADRFVYRHDEYARLLDDIVGAFADLEDAFRRGADPNEIRYHRARLATLRARLVAWRREARTLGAAER